MTGNSIDLTKPKNVRTVIDRLETVLAAHDEPVEAVNYFTAGTIGFALYSTGTKERLVVSIDDTEYIFDARGALIGQQEIEASVEDGE